MKQQLERLLATDPKWRNVVDECLRQADLDRSIGARDGSFAGKHVLANLPAEHRPRNLQPLLRIGVLVKLPPARQSRANTYYAFVDEAAVRELLAAV
jgi:hypothetical protein